MQPMILVDRASGKTVVIFGMLVMLSMAMLQASNVHASQSQTLIFESPENGGAFVELYTSQGCSSCPPAERWFSKLSKDDRLWTSLFPIAFHVDYWDYLGWRDPFSSPAFSLRQRAHEHYAHTNTVATPGFVVDGKGWNGWFRGRSLPKLVHLNNVGKLRARLKGQDIQFKFTQVNDPIEKLSRPKGHVAILGFDIVVPVKGGENKGRALTHDFVVLGYRTSYLLESGNEWSDRLKRPNTDKYTDYKTAAVFWVTDGEDPEAMQVAGGWLPFQ